MGLCPPIQDLGNLEPSLELAQGSTATWYFPSECLQSDKCQPTLTWPTAPQIQAGQRSWPWAPRRPSRESPPLLSTAVPETSTNHEALLAASGRQEGPGAGLGRGMLPVCPGSDLRRESSARKSRKPGRMHPTLVTGTEASEETPA